MAWCPKCKNEYREGVTICPDCEIELVDELVEEEESDAEPKPVILLEPEDNEVGEKVVNYLRLNGVVSGALLSDEDKLAVIVADLELDICEQLFPGLVVGEHVDIDRLYELVPDIEDQFDEVENEQAEKEFSELRSEASTVYVKKRDKYADLKFSGYSFIGFGVIGLAIVALNLAGIINLFNIYSMIVMSLVFVIFFIIGFATLHRASLVKESVAVEDEFTAQLEDWIKDNLGDEVIDEWYDENKQDQENYFEIHDRLCQMMQDEFPNIHPSYIEELAEERYNSYLERSGFESPEDVPVEEDVTPDVFEEEDIDADDDNPFEEVD